MEEQVCILVVEDEQKIREALRDFLEFHGFKVSEAVDGLDAERIVDEDHFDLILLDLMLPKISGEQLCVKWRQQGLQTPIIMLTAKGQQTERVSGLDLGADDYITKPGTSGAYESHTASHGPSAGGRSKFRVRGP